MAKSRRSRHEDAALTAFLTQLRSLRKHQGELRPDLENMGLVIKEAYRYKQMGESLGQDFMDLVQAGYEGLCRALERFEPERGFKLSTMASWWIRASITRLLCDAPGGRAVRLPGIKVEALRDLQKATDQLTTELVRPPRQSEIVAYFLDKFGQSAEETHQLMAYAHYNGQSLQDNDPDDDSKPGAGLENLVEQKTFPDPMVVVILRRDSARFRAALSALDNRTQLIIVERFGLQDGEPKTLQQIGQRLQLSRERVRQILVLGLSRLKAAQLDDDTYE